jgi:hypothetical protein
MKTELYYYVLGVVTLGVGIVAQPYVKTLWNAVKTWISREKNNKDIVDILIIAKLQDRIDELEKQINNVAENHYRRETNRKNNIRREVRSYLEELKND